MSSSSSSAPSRSRAGNKATADNDELGLKKSILKIIQNQETFAKSVAECKSLIDEQLSDLELKTTAKRKAMSDLDEEFNQNQKSRKLDLEHDLRLHGYNAAVKLIKERKEVPIAEEELAKLKAELELLKRDHTTQIQTIAKEARAQYEKELAAYQLTSDLKHQAEIARNESKILQLTDHVKVLDAQIANQKSDLDKQMKLTESVAKSAQPQYYPAPQSSGRDR